MKTRKKIAIILAILSVAAIGSCLAIDLSSGSDFIISTDDIEYHTKEELTDLYWQNKTLLNDVKNSVLSNKGMMQELIDFKEGDTGILTDYQKEYFTDEEWANIVSVFENLHPYMLMMERKGRPLVFYIACGHLKQGSTSYANYLYWFPNEEEREYHENPGVFPDGVFTQLDEGWYIVETTSTR